MEDTIRGEIVEAEKVEVVAKEKSKMKEEKNSKRTRKRRRDDAFKLLELKMRRLQLQPTEGTAIRQQFWRQFWGDFSLLNEKKSGRVSF